MRNISPVQLSISGYLKNSTKEPFTQILKKTLIIGQTMSDKQDRIRIGLGVTIPEVLGPYSSVRFECSVEHEGDADKLEEEANKYKGRIQTLVARELNNFAVSCGKDPVFPEISE